MKRVRKENNIKKIIKTFLFSLIVVIIYELLLRYILKKNYIIYIYNIIIETIIVSFALMHFTIGMKKVYSYIIENRYRVSLILIVISTIIGFFGNPIRNKRMVIC